MKIYYNIIKCKDGGRYAVNKKLNKKEALEGVEAQEFAIDNCIIKGLDNDDIYFAIPKNIKHTVMAKRISEFTKKYSDKNIEYIFKGIL